MNVAQFSEELSALLKARVWADSPGALVFGPDGVYVTAGGLEEAIGRVRVPCALVQIGDAQHDDEHPEVLTQTFQVAIITLNQGDAMGEAGLLGGHSSPGESAGRGVLEIEEEVYRTLLLLDQTHGIRVKLAGRSVADAAVFGGNAIVNSRVLSFEAVLLAFRSFPPPSGFAAIDSGGGVAALSWQLAPNRYDTMTQVLRRAAGSTPPATVADGTNVVVGAAAVTLNDNPGAGTWSYSLFAAYDADRNGVADTYSSPVTATVEVT